MVADGTDRVWVWASAVKVLGVRNFTGDHRTNVLVRNPSSVLDPTNSPAGPDRPDQTVTKDPVDGVVDRTPNANPVFGPSAFVGGIGQSPKRV